MCGEKNNKRLEVQKKRVRGAVISLVLLRLSCLKGLIDVLFYFPEIHIRDMRLHCFRKMLMHNL